MRDWLKYDKGSIFRDKSKGGLLIQFLKEYKEQFGGSINPSCNKCLNSYYDNYLKSLKMEDFKEKEVCNYELHKKYDGIQLKFKGVRIQNKDLTNKLAEKLLKEHPHGAKLFSKIPEIKEEIKVVEKKTRKKRTPKTNK